MVDVSASSDEVRAALDDLLQRENAIEKRKILSEASFKEWIYNTLYHIFAQMGYRLQSFEEFWRDVGVSVSSGWADGRKQAKEEAEIRRKRRERERRNRQ